jgi:aminopeptidase-like protein
MTPASASARAEIARDGDAVGDFMYDLARSIYPICRSITGDGVRETFGIPSRHLPIRTSEVPSGTAVFDWTVPREWAIRDAYIRNEAGERVVDFRASNLHVVNYSAPIHARLPLSELKRHIHTLPDQPDLIPYRTTYYAETWGFCMAHDHLMALPDGVYEVRIDSELRDGALTYGEWVHPGETEDEFLLSAHICHPSLANDNCSGVALLAALGQWLAARRTRYTYRLIFAPGTIGAITWLALHREQASRIKHGLAVACVGDAGGPTYKRSRRGNAAIDRVMARVLRRNVPGANIVDFSPYGYDERQYCSPGFDLPVGLFQRSHFGRFPEYHTSADNLDFIRPEHLALSYRLVVEAIQAIEDEPRPVSRVPWCEPQLGRRALYEPSSDPAAAHRNLALLWVLNLSDGEHSFADMAERAGMPLDIIAGAARRLREAELIAF